MAHNLGWLRDQFIAAGRDERAWDRLLASFGGTTLAHISQYAALLLTPDFAPQGLSRPLFQWFQRWGCAPVAAVPHLFNPAEITLLYSGRVTHRNRKGRMHSSWLSPRLYGMGTSILLILRATGEARPPLQERITKDKGISRYGEHTTDHLRGISRIADRCISLVHSPDDYEGLIHLTELVIGIKATAAALHPDREPMSEEEFNALAPKVDLAEEPHPFDLPLRLIQQGVVLLIGDPRVPLSTRLSRKVFRSVADERKSLCGIGSDSRLEEATWQALSRLAPQLEELTRQQFAARDTFSSWRGLKFIHARLELCRVMQEMCARESFDPCLSRDVIETFRRNQLMLDPWDEQRLHVLAAFHGVDSSSDAAIQRPAEESTEKGKPHV